MKIVLMDDPRDAKASHSLTFKSIDEMLDAKTHIQNLIRTATAIMNSCTWEFGGNPEELQLEKEWEQAKEAALASIGDKP